MKKYTFKVRKDFIRTEKVTVLAKDKQTAVMIAKSMTKVKTV